LQNSEICYVTCNLFIEIPDLGNVWKFWLKIIIKLQTTDEELQLAPIPTEASMLDQIMLDQRPGPDDTA